MDFSDPIAMMKKGLSDLVRSREDSRLRTFEILAGFERRAAWQGADWTSATFEDAPDELAALTAEDPSLSELDRRCKAWIAKDAKTKTALILEIEKGPKKGLAARVRAMVEAGADPNEATLLKDVPLAYARDRGVRDVFDLLIELGAETHRIGFGGLHHAVRYGALEDVIPLIGSEDVLKSRMDADSVLYEAVLAAKSDILKAILAHVAERGLMADPEVEGCFELAVQEGAETLVMPFLEHGIDATRGLDSTLLKYDTKLLELLIAHGADVAEICDLSLYHDDPWTVLDADGQPAMWGYTRALLKAGWVVENLEEFEQGQIRFVTGATRIAPQDTKAAAFAQGAGLIDVEDNPTDVTAPFQLEMLRTGKTPHTMRKSQPLPEPAWTADRFGMTTTLLPDGRWVQIAGEHEDFYDPDFAIFNDVIVHDGQGGAQVFAYPRTIFPPTDFHSATLIGDTIWVIGNLGYGPQRREGVTQVCKLSTRDFTITQVATTGEAPGWISRHKTRLAGTKIIIVDGQVWSNGALRDVTREVSLDTETLEWMRDT